jgi:AraC family transcriptional regulator, exoenzyme S synthesis regulatory protein ExsA
MKPANKKYIECNSLQIATSVELSNRQEHTVYYPSHALIFVQQGQFNFKYNNELISIEANNFCLIRKHTSLNCFKTWSENEDGFKLIAFILNDEFIKKVALKLPVITGSPESNNKPFLPVSPNTILLGLMSSLEIYLNDKQDINPDIVELKTLESLIGIAQQNTSILHYLSGASQLIKADLPEFMEHYFSQKLAIKELAELSGRSVATFHREFKSIYNTSPHQWIKERRLQKAKELLLNTTQKPSEIYLDLGFEDLSHFSRSFKQYFGKNPSEVAALAI